MKPKILFFSRSFFSKFFAEIDSEIYDDYHVTLNLREKKLLENKGKIVCGCFEEDYSTIVPVDFPDNYLRSSFSSDRFLVRFNYEKRIEILGKEIGFWRKIFEEIKPNFIVNETVALEISEVLALEAKKYKIQVLSAICSVISESFYWKPDPFIGSILDINTLKVTKGNILKAKEYYNNVLENNYKPIYVHSFSYYRKFPIKSYIGTLYRDSLLCITKQKLRSSKIFHYEDEYSTFPFQNTKRFLNRILFRYDNLESFKQKKIIFYPMHFEPEATLFHFAEEYQNQAHTIEMIARALKIHQYLAIKEHPQQKGALLDKRYRDLKRKHSNLVFLPAEIPIKEIINISEAIVTLTSTAAWEGLIFGKPVFVLGTIFYDQCPGVKKVNSYSHLKDLLRQTNYHIPEKDKVIDFISKLYSILNLSYPSPYFKGNFRTNVSCFSNAIEEAIK